MEIRLETAADVPAVYAVNAAAFDGEAEAKAVDIVRASDITAISLVAVTMGEVIGHILFSSVTLSDHPDARIMGLAPLAVAPKAQRTGVGSALVVAGLERCKQQGTGAVVVLGHPSYYPKFGFRPAVAFKLKCEYDVPADVFMAMEIEPDYLRHRPGVIRYHRAFQE